MIVWIKIQSFFIIYKKIFYIKYFIIKFKGEDVGKNIKTFVLLSLIVALILAIFLSPFASLSPDGLEKVAEDKGFIEKALEEGVWRFSPIPDYAFPGISNEAIATSIAGLIGTLITVIIGWLIAKLIIIKK